MFPLKERKITGYKFGVPTFYSNFHLGVDYGKEDMTLFAPFNGKVTRTIPLTQAPNGGNTIWFKPDHDDVIIRFLHLKKFLVQPGHYTEGTPLAITDNTGVSTKAHVHIDISRKVVDINKPNNFIDPEKYNWIGKGQMVIYKKQGEDALYFPVGDRLVGYATDFPTFQAEFPNALIVELSASEFAKFTVSSLVVKK